jgi:hypothetical protein
MTAPAAPAIDEIRVAPMSFADSAAQTPLVARHRDDVHMVGHQAPGPDLHVPPHGLPGQQIAIDVLVAVLEEDRLPTLATLGNMVGRMADNAAAQAGHVQR